MKKPGISARYFQRSLGPPLPSSKIRSSKSAFGSWDSYILSAPFKSSTGQYMRPPLKNVPFFLTQRNFLDRIFPIAPAVPLNGTAVQWTVFQAVSFMLSSGAVAASYVAIAQLDRASAS